MLQAVGGSQAADRKARAAGVWEAQRACDVPKFTESRGPGFRWSLSDSKSYRSAFHGSRSSKGEPRGLCLRHGGGGATRLEGREEPPENEFGNHVGHHGLPNPNYRLSGWGSPVQRGVPAQPIIQMEKLRARGGQGWSGSSSCPRLRPLSGILPEPTQWSR